MNELDKAYENFEILKALDLPISRDQLENIERLEDENAKEHREELRIYYYKKCYACYTKRILNIRQAKIRGEIIIAKPVLLLAIIDGIGECMFLTNEFQLTEWLEKRYVILMQKYMQKSQFDKITDIANPFWHLQTDGFWHLQFTNKLQEGKTSSKYWLKKNIDFAYFEDDFWELLRNELWRNKIREYIVAHKLLDM